MRAWGISHFMLFIDSSVFFILAVLPERLGVAGALQNPRTREEESAWGWLGNLVHKGSDAARYWDPGCSCVGCNRPAFSRALFWRSIRPHSASSFPIPLMSADEDQPVRSLAWGLSPNKAADLHASWGEILLISSFRFPFGLSARWKHRLSRTRMIGWADFFWACTVIGLRTPWVGSCVGAVIPRTWQIQPDLTWSLLQQEVGPGNSALSQGYSCHQAFMKQNSLGAP